jgi:hypothetical protein
MKRIALLIAFVALLAVNAFSAARGSSPCTCPACACDCHATTGPATNPTTNPTTKPTTAPTTLPTGKTFTEAFIGAPVVNGVRQVVLPAGTFTLTAKLKILDNVAITTAGKVVIRYTGTVDNECFGLYAAGFSIAGVEFQGDGKTHLFRVWGATDVRVDDVVVSAGGGLCRLSNAACKLTVRNLSGQATDNFIYVSDAAKVDVDGWVMKPPAAYGHANQPIHEHGLRSEDSDCQIEVQHFDLDCSDSYANKSAPFAIHGGHASIHDGKVKGNIGFGGLPQKDDAASWQKPDGSGNYKTTALDCWVRDVEVGVATTRFVKKKDGSPETSGGQIAIRAGVTGGCDNVRLVAKNGGGILSNNEGASSVRKGPQWLVTNTTVTSSYAGDGFAKGPGIKLGAGNVLVQGNKRIAQQPGQLQQPAN